MEPTDKSEPITAFLEELAGRTTSITNNTCVPAPVGCGKNVHFDNFKDYVSLKEYQISGLCQECQDSIFD